MTTRPRRRDRDPLEEWARAERAAARLATVKLGGVVLLIVVASCSIVATAGVACVSMLRSVG
jgi:hypothetical protein